MYNWYWLVDGLQAAGYKVHLAHCTAIKKYEGLKHSGDEADVRHLAHLLRLGILPTGTILLRDQRAVRDLGRNRMQLVRSRTLYILAVENITACERGARISSGQVKCLTSEVIDRKPVSEDVALAINAYVAVVTTLSAQIDLLENVSRKPSRSAPSTISFRAFWALVGYWPRRSCRRLSRLTALPAQATLPPMHAA